MYDALRRAMFRLDPERAHHLATGLLKRANRGGVARRLIRVPNADPRLRVEAFGSKFASPLGIAAGFDKEAEVYNALMALGFSHVEIGTVTPKPQPGNAGPRIQRFADHQALVNRLGFPGPGMDAVASRLRLTKPQGPLGINIGPNKETPAEKVADSLARIAERLARFADYFAINVSSPNTPGLRALQTPEAVARLVQRTLEGVDGTDHDVPVLLKVHPDSPPSEILPVAQSAIDAGASGIIAVNTTKERMPGMDDAIEGGMSGHPLQQRAREMVGALHQGLGRETPIVGVGGVFNGDDVFAMMQAGASLVQTYTGFIYEGPRMATKVNHRLVQLLDEHGIDRLDEVVGTN